MPHKPPTVVRFPVAIPPDFVQGEVLINASKKNCPCQKAPHKPSWGGGFFALRRGFLHKAIDIMAAEGSLVRSVCDGVVCEQLIISRKDIRPGVGSSSKGGWYVTILSKDNHEWYYAHLRFPPLVQPGEEVKAGQILGYVGRTGNASRLYGDGTVRGCPHLHLRVQRGASPSGKKLDPKPLLQALYDAEDYFKGPWPGEQE